MSVVVSSTEEAARAAELTARQREANEIYRTHYIEPMRVAINGWEARKNEIEIAARNRHASARLVYSQDEQAAKAGAAAKFREAGFEDEARAMEAGQRPEGVEE